MEAKTMEAFGLLSKNKQHLIYELIVNLIPDDIATPEDLIAHNEAIQEFLRGETTDFDDIDWE